MPCSASCARSSARLRRARIPAWTRGWSVLTRPPSSSGKPGRRSSTGVTARPASRERGRRAPARHQLEPEIGETAREGHEARSCRRPRSARAQLADDLGKQTVLGRVDALAQRLDGVARRERAPARSRSRSRCRLLRPRSAPSQRPRGAPAASRSSSGCAPGKSGSGAGWTLTTRSGKALEERRRQEVHVPRADDELDALRLEPVGHRGVTRLAIGVVGRARNSPPARARTAARASARASGVLDATATTGSPASSSACRFVPSPLTRTPITRARSSR